MAVDRKVMGFGPLEDAVGVFEGVVIFVRSEFERHELGFDSDGIEFAQNEVE